MPAEMKRMLVLFNHSFNKYLYALIMPGTVLYGEDILSYRKCLLTISVELKSSNLFFIKSYKNSAILQITLTHMTSFE